MGSAGAGAGAVDIGTGSGAGDIGTGSGAGDIGTGSGAGDIGTGSGAGDIGTGSGAGDIGTGAGVVSMVADVREEGAAGAVAMSGADADSCGPSPGSGSSFSAAAGTSSSTAAGTSSSTAGSGAAPAAVTAGDAAGSIACGWKARVCSASPSLPPGRGRSTAASPGSPHSVGIGSGTVCPALFPSAIRRSIRPAAADPRRWVGSRLSSPLMTGHNGPARLGGSGSSVTTAVSVASAPGRSYGGLPSTTA